MAYINSIHINESIPLGLANKTNREKSIKQYIKTEDRIFLLLLLLLLKDQKSSSRAQIPSRYRRKRDAT